MMMKGIGMSNAKTIEKELTNTPLSNGISETHSYEENGVDNKKE
jgi:hypothetical protein